MENGRGAIALALEYVKGDATQPVGQGPKVLVHVCNDLGKWGKGFVLALSKRWSEPEAAYRTLSQNGSLKLGEVQFVRVAADITVANLIGQRGVARRGRTDPPIRYDAVRLGLQRVAEEAKAHHASVHMPRIGTGLAGGEWHEIESIVHETLIAADVEVTVYDHAPSSSKSTLR